MVNRRDKVSYFYDADVPFNYYGTEHPMKPARLRLAHHLVLNYGLHRLMNVYRPHIATLQEMAVYHSPEYLECMQRASASSSKVGQEELNKFGLGQGMCDTSQALEQSTLLNRHWLALYIYCSVHVGAAKTH
jgi:acetoin utilization deacetylase AcuC-like enzyme